MYFFFSFVHYNYFLCIQVIAARNQDKLCLAVAEELEKAFGGWVAPPTKQPM